MTQEYQSKSIPKIPLSHLLVNFLSKENDGFRPGLPATDYRQLREWCRTYLMSTEWYKAQRAHA